jgi:small-conductance mechanosensitive channel
MLALTPRILVFWNVFDNIYDAYSQLMTVGITIGKLKISIGILITSISILYGSYVLATINEMILMNANFDKKLDKGTRLSIAQLLRYFLLFFGFLIAISVIGFDLTNFTIVLSALSVGIGFGLQGLVNNFVSGLILLFERPIREGDTIEIEGLWSDVKKIGLRSTTVQTFDQSDVIIPNADLVYNKVTNWTLTNQMKRLKIAVGVAYGSDVNLVIETLKEIGTSNNDLVKFHKPIVLFVNFADSTLNFELRVWAKDAKNSMQIESDLRQEIDKRFRENNIEIAFPQRDLHIRSIDKEAILKTTENNLK